MKNFKFTLSFLLAVCIVFSDCRKHNLKLKSRNLREIKRAISGEWQLHYSKGGFTGDQKTYFRHTFLDFQRNDLFVFVLEGHEYARTKIDWIKHRDIFGDETFLLKFTALRGDTYYWIVDDIVLDTLRLNDNFYDGYSYFLSKM